jgi:flagellar biosynthesis protein FlhG
MNRLQFKYSAPKPGNEERTGPTVVSVLSGKGGVGKSVISFNLGERLSLAGLKVLVVDADYWCGNIHILANVDSDQGLCQHLNGQLTLEESVVPVAERFDILPSGSGDIISESVEPAAARRLIAKLRQLGVYDFILIDHPSGRSEMSIALACESDVNVLVLVPELASIADCYGLYKHLLHQFDTLDCRLLLNRVGREDDAEFIRGKFLAVAERFLGRVPGDLGSITESEAIRKAVARQSTISAIAEEDTAIQSLNAIKDRLVSDREFSGLLQVETDEIAINESTAVADTKE